MLLDWLSDDYPRFPEFQRMLREYERELDAVNVSGFLKAYDAVKAPVAEPVYRYVNAGTTDLEAGNVLSDSWFHSVDLEPGTTFNRGASSFWRNRH